MAISLPNMIKNAGYPGSAEDIIACFFAGSDLHGAAMPGKSDLDLAGVFIEDPEKNLGLDKIEHFVTSTGNNESRNNPDDVDVQMHSLRHWAFLASAGNPTILATLFAPVAVQGTVWTTDILPNAEWFVARKHVNAFMGYSLNQLHRMQGNRGSGKHGQRPELEAQFGYDTKAAMHMIRLMYEGIELMTTGRITYPRPEKDLLLEIRKGAWSQTKVESHFSELELELRAAELTSPLPKQVDRAKVSSIVASAYLSHWHSRGLIKP